MHGHGEVYRRCAKPLAAIGSHIIYKSVHAVHAGGGERVRMISQLGHGR